MDAGIAVVFEECYPPLDTWFEVRVYPSETGLSVFFRDITERRRAQEQLQFQESLLRAQAESSLDGMIVVSADQKILSCNQRFVEMWGLKGDLVGQQSAEVRTIILDQLMDPEAFMAQSTYLHEHSSERTHDEIELTDGRVLERFSCPVHTPDGVRRGRTWFYRDVTDRKRLETQLAHQAFHDFVTGLPNRALFVDRVEMSLSGTQRTGHRVAVLFIFIDLDNFKVINDSLGHAVGDQLLISVGARLQECVREIDAVSRFGGDEFAILLPEVDDGSAAAVVADRIVVSLRQPFVPNGGNFHVTTSIGIAISGPRSMQSEELLRLADIAMYRAKGNGRNQYTVFQHETHGMALTRLERENDLRRAIDDKEFFLVFQPVVELSTGDVMGIEALVRWRHPARGVLAPSEFIALAEETGLIVPLGRMVLRMACTEAAGWTQRRPDGNRMRIAVNLSPRQFEAPGLDDDVREILDETRIPPSSLVLELTESTVMHDARSAIDRLVGLKALGVRIAVDDFGTGYSSLAYLRRFPVDVLKIDREFNSGLGDDPDDDLIVSATIALGGSLGLLLIAEGVETEEQAERLLSLGCEFGQGYYYGEPSPTSEFLGRSFHQPITS